MCRDNSQHLLKYLFWYMLVLYVNFSVICLKLATKRPLSYFQPTLAAFFYQSNGESQINTRPYTWAIVLMNY